MILRLMGLALLLPGPTLFASPETIDRYLSFEQTLQNFVNQRNLPSAVASISDGSHQAPQIVSLGNKNKEGHKLESYERIPLGSLTKSFTAALSKSLAEKGQINLDAPISELLGPQFKIHSEFKNLSLNGLMAHMGGFPGESVKVNTYLDPSTSTRLDYAKALLSRKPSFKVGKHRYSTHGYAVIGAILEAKTGKSWEQLVQEELLDPLKLSSCKFLDLPKGTAPTDRLMTEAQRNALPWGSEHGGKQSTISPVKSNVVLHPLLNPGAGLYCSLSDLMTFVRLQTVDNKGSGYLFEVPPGQPNQTTYGAWSLMRKDKNGRWYFACQYGAQAGISLIACIDRRKNIHTVAALGSWGLESDRALEDLVEVLAKEAARQKTDQKSPDALPVKRAEPIHR